MKQFRLLADYRQFKAGQIISGYVETLDFNGVLDVNLVTEVDGREILIPIKFVEETSNNKVFIVVVVVLIVGFVLYKIFKK